MVTVVILAGPLAVAEDKIEVDSSLRTCGGVEILGCGGRHGLIFSYSSGGIRDIGIMDGWVEEGVCVTD